MIPKGLILAVSVGVFAALGLGAYLEKSYDNTSVKFSQGPSLSIITDKRDYQLDETIQVVLINSGTTEISFSSFEPSFKVRALDGTEFYSMYSAGAKLAPKEKITINWSQQKNDKTHVLEGRYVLDSFGLSQNTKIHSSTTVNILK